MKKLTKLFLVTTSTVALTASAVAGDNNNVPVVASDLEVKLSGYTHFQAGFRNQSNLKGDQKKVSNARKGFAFYNDSSFAVDVSNTVDNLTYGAKINLVTTSQRKGGVNYNGSHIFAETEYGRFEAGSPYSASYKMFIDAGEISTGTGNGDWDRYAEFDVFPDSTAVANDIITGSKLQPSFATSEEFYISDRLNTKNDSLPRSKEPSRSISYYTPKYKFNNTKVQLGVTYTPDSNNTGAGKPGENSGGTEFKVIRADGVLSSAKKSFAVGDFVRKGSLGFVVDRSVKDTFSGGFTLEQNLADGVDLKLGLTGSYGKSTGKIQRLEPVNNSANLAVVTNTYKLNDLRTYNIGAVLTFGQFAVAGSYGSLGKSLTAPEFHKTGQKTDYYTGAVAYKQGPFTTSVSYFKSNQYKNTVDAVSVGADYKLAPGIKPYAELSAFTLKGRPEFFEGAVAPEKKKSRGTVALIGAKLSF